MTSHSIPDLVNAEPGHQRDHLLQQEQRIRVRYAELSDQYQLSKGDNDIPFSLTRSRHRTKLVREGPFTAHTLVLWLST